MGDTIRRSGEEGCRRRWARYATSSIAALRTIFYGLKLSLGIGFKPWIILLRRDRTGDSIVRLLPAISYIRRIDFSFVGELTWSLLRCLQLVNIRCFIERKGVKCRFNTPTCRKCAFWSRSCETRKTGHQIATHDRFGHT